MDSAANGCMEHWGRYLDDFTPSATHRHEAFALRVCRLAVDAVRAGSYGVGALLFDSQGSVVLEGRNRVYDSGFRSDLHAEMVVVNEYESVGRSREQARDLTLVTSLEPCPMCMSRLIVAGIGSVLYVSEDPLGGMVKRERSLPPTFRSIMRGEGQVWGAADCSTELRAAAFRIWGESREILGEWQPNRERSLRGGRRVAVS